MIPAFDGHIDTLKVLDEHPERSFGARSEQGHVDLPRAREGGLRGALFAMFTPQTDLASLMGPGRDRDRPVGPIDPDRALRDTLRMFGLLYDLQDRGWVRVVGDAASLDKALRDGVLAAVPHIEGAEAIPEDLGALPALHRLGLRSLGLVWSRPNAFGFGVPFAFGSSPDCGPGLTEAGTELVRACDELGILVDTAHLNARGFWDVLELREGPVVASHANAHAVCPSPRNLTDDQLDALAERDALVGLNFSCAFLDPQGRPDTGLSLDVPVRHLDHLLARLGPDRVALGSDFDGATVPDVLADVTRLPRLWEALRGHGYDDALLARLARDNWLDLLRRTWAG